jgi:hypothetical protein
MIVCLEDDMTELRRRVRSAMLHHKVKASEVTRREKAIGILSAKLIGPIEDDE